MDDIIYPSWIELGIIRGPDGLVVEALNARPHRKAAGPGHTLVWFGHDITIPTRTLDLVTGAAAGMPISAHTGTQIALPVFVAPRAGLRHLAWEEALAPVLASAAPNRNLQLIRLARPIGRMAPALGLPIVMLTVGDAATQALAEVRGRNGWLADPEIAHALPMVATKDSRLAIELRRLRPAIVVAGDRHVPELLRWAAGTPRGGARPLRLVVALCDANAVRIDRAPDDTAIAQVAYSEVVEFLDRLVLAIAHDLPLPTRSEDRLNANPASVASLRLSPLGQRLARQIGHGGIAVDDLAFPGDAGVSRIHADQLGRYFQESDGLRKLARTTRALAAPETHRARWSQRSTGSSPETLESAAPARAVDLQLERLGARAGTSYDTPLTPWMPRTSTLQVGTTYRLTMTIGSPLLGSLFQVAPPSLDGVLPQTDTGRHELEVAVYGPGFRLVSAPLRRMVLSRVGAPSPIHFDVVPRALGPARLRIVIYFRNQAVQAFRLVALVEATERDGQAYILSAELEFSRSPALANLARLERRMFNIGVNAGPGATHQIMMKGDGGAPRDIGLPQGVIATQMKTLRADLVAAAFDLTKPNPLKSPRFATNTSPTSSDFKQVMRSLIDQGVKLYGLLRPRGDHKQLKAIAAAADQTIQIVRYDPAFAFPWVMVYDFHVPQLAVGAPEPEICLGIGAGGSDTCTHGPGQSGYCIRGFWGVRHIVEQVLAIGERDDTICAAASTSPPIKVSLGINDVYGQAIVSALQSIPATAVAAGRDAVLDTLWTDAARPSQIIIYSHLETRVISTQPAGRRLVFTDGSVLRVDDIDGRYDDYDGPWSEPQTVVFLMACGTVAADDEMLSDFATSLHTAGARAIAGTEVVTQAGLLSEFASEVTTAWWAPALTRQLGEVVRQFRIKLLRAGNPLGFVFTLLGNADLTTRNAGGPS